MPADQIRNRTVGCKMTDGEYERLSAVVESEAGGQPSSLQNDFVVVFPGVPYHLRSSFLQMAGGRSLNARYDLGWLRDGVGAILGGRRSLNGRF